MAEREGLKAVQMFEAIERGEIKALWVMATNPAVSLPRAGAVREALKKLELFVVSENVLDERHRRCRGAHVLLPAAAWGEKDGTVTNSERRISRQRAFLPLPGDAQAGLVDRRRGRAAHGLRRRVRLSLRRRHLPRARRAVGVRERRRARTSISAGSRRSRDEDYDALEPVQWPVPAGAAPGPARLFADGGFCTPDRKARFVAPEPPALREATSAEFPLRLNTGRVRDQWHTMTRTGRARGSARTSRSRSWRSIRSTPRRTASRNGGFARVRIAARRLHAQGRDRGGPAARLGLRADPLERRQLRRRRASAIWCRRRPIRSPASPKPRRRRSPSRRLPSPIAALRWRARPLALPDGTWWARVALAGAAGIPVRDERCADGLARTRAGPVSARRC